MKTYYKGIEIDFQELNSEWQVWELNLSDMDIRKVKHQIDVIQSKEKKLFNEAVLKYSPCNGFTLLQLESVDSEGKIWCTDKDGKRELVGVDSLFISNEETREIVKVYSDLEKEKERIGKESNTLIVKLQHQYCLRDHLIEFIQKEI